MTKRVAAYAEAIKVAVERVATFLVSVLLAVLSALFRHHQTLRFDVPTLRQTATTCQARLYVIVEISTAIAGMPQLRNALISCKVVPYVHGITKRQNVGTNTKG
jgi:hypothetical protein